MNSQSLAGSGARPAFPLPSKDALGPRCPGTFQGPTERPGVQPLEQGLEAASYSQSPMYQQSLTNPLLAPGASVASAPQAGLWDHWLLLWGHTLGGL